MSRNWRDYFDLTVPYTLVKLTDIILLRARPEGLSSAIERMREAALGNFPKRPPISLRKRHDLYVVEDGNSTTIILAAIGVKVLPAYVIGSEIADPASQ